MPHFSDIWDAVRDDVANHRVIDVDIYCRRFSRHHPELTFREIEEMVLDAVGMYGGAAVWGLRERPHGD